MFKFLFKSKFLGFVEAPVGVFWYIFPQMNIFFFVGDMNKQYLRKILLWEDYHEEKAELWY